jgi:Flp pilus assembly pilin Flp
MTLEVNMVKLLAGLWREEDGQDVIEYTLLMAFVALATCSLFALSRDSIMSINSKCDARLSTAYQAAGN